MRGLHGFLTVYCQALRPGHGHWARRLLAWADFGRQVAAIGPARRVSPRWLTRVLVVAALVGPHLGSAADTAPATAPKSRSLPAELGQSPAVWPQGTTADGWRPLRDRGAETLATTQCEAKAPTPARKLLPSLLPIRPKQGVAPTQVGSYGVTATASWIASSSSASGQLNPQEPLPPATSESANSDARGSNVVRCSAVVAIDQRVSTGPALPCEPSELPAPGPRELSPLPVPGQ